MAGTDNTGAGRAVIDDTADVAAIHQVIDNIDTALDTVNSERALQHHRAALEIALTNRLGVAERARTQAGQAMDDDGCGICDACLDAPLQTTGNPDGLDFPDAFPHLSLTARHR